MAKIFLRALPAGTALVFLVGLALAAPEAGNDDGHPGKPAYSVCPCSLEQLAGLGWAELECLYGGAEAGLIPCGFARGRTVYCPDQPLAHARSRLARCFWLGKHFHGYTCTLINQWRGFKAIRARVFYGPSWLDGKTSIIMDYQGESRIWDKVRDEMRQVGCGLYVGAMILRGCCQPHLKLFFVLESCT